MRLKPRQNYEENEREAYGGETGSSKWGSRWPRLAIELRLARQTDCSKGKLYEWLGLLEEVAVGLNWGKYQDNFRVFWNWAWNKPQNPSVSFLLLSNTYAAQCFYARIDYLQPSQQVWREQTCLLREKYLGNFSFQTLTAICWECANYASAIVNRSAMGGFS